MRPYFSVIVPVYNVENQLKYCINSILEQSFKDYEILLIDDGSKDGSSKLCDEFDAEYSFIHSYHKPNGGLSDARNFGMKIAKGKFYLFIDSDDVIDSDFCQILYDAHQKYNADIVSTGILAFHGYDELEQLQNKEYDYSEKVLQGKEILKEYYAPNEKTYINHGLCMKSYKSELFEQLQFEKGRLHEDLFITYKLLDRSNTLVYVDLPYYYYYQNPESITHNYKEKNYRDEVDALLAMIDYFKNRQDIGAELTLFVLNHYFYLMMRAMKLSNNLDKTKETKRVAKWLCANIWRCKGKKVIKKVVYFFAVKQPMIYLKLVHRNRC